LLVHDITWVFVVLCVGVTNAEISTLNVKCESEYGKCGTFHEPHGASSAHLSYTVLIY